jgi:hypothetical protein
MPARDHDRKVPKETLMIAKTPKSRYADHIKEWEDLTTSLLPSATEAPQIEIQRATLQAMLERVKSLTGQQATFQAQKQEVSSQLGTLMAEGRRLSSVLRATVKQHYGIRNEKLIQFGIQPFRGRKVKPTPPPEDTPAPSPQPAAASSSPATPAAE